ncbi:hypothetical protein Trydic_g18407, partial [Trypoxylus dichotomus]
KNTEKTLLRGGNFHNSEGLQRSIVCQGRKSALTDSKNNVKGSPTREADAEPRLIV